MERCDFCSVMVIIRKYISEGRISSQLNLLYQLFKSFMGDDVSADFDFDRGLISKWFSGNLKVSPRIVSFYVNNRAALIDDIENSILTNMYDAGAAMQELHDLVVQDPTCSESQRLVLLSNYPDLPAAFLADVLIFAMEREFIKRDAKYTKRLTAGSLSPIVRDHIFSDEISEPCRHFCGRDEELAKLHDLLLSEKKVFLHGIAGIGKSELVKAYVSNHRKEYTNIIYLSYSGSLEKDITDLSFSDDRDEETDKERLRRHNRFLRTLREDTLIIIDNFDTVAIKEPFLYVIMKYHCRIIFTSRNLWNGYPSMELTEILDTEALLGLIEAFYSRAGSFIRDLSQCIDLVHRHTLAVELIGRLLQRGILTPPELLMKLSEENVAISSTDKIALKKDGITTRQTYYEHIRFLFTLYALGDASKQVMRSMTFVPQSGIPARLLAKWLQHEDINTINDLIESGLIKSVTEFSVALHPLIREVAAADLAPSVTNCSELLASLDVICLAHGDTVPYYRLLFNVIENISEQIHVDDMTVFLHFLEDAIMYMENYEYYDGMRCLTDILRNLLQDPGNGTDTDRASLLMCQAFFDKYSEQSLRLHMKALDLLPDETDENVFMLSNIHSNISAIYRTQKKIDLAILHQEEAIDLLKRQGLLSSPSGIVQLSNYSVLLHDVGRISESFAALREAEQTVSESYPVFSEMTASIASTKGMLYLSEGRISEATVCFMKSIKIYDVLFEGDEALLDSKYLQIAGLYPQAAKLFREKYESWKKQKLLPVNALNLSSE